MPIKRIIDLCERRGFLNKLSTVLNIGPVGTLLQENLKNEWFYNMIINRDNTVFFCNDNNNSFSATYNFAKDVCKDRLPFGIAEIIEGKPTVAQNLNGSEFDFDGFLTNKRLLLQTTMFVAPGSATQFFHRWQRERKMWWRKFSASPGRYFLSDIQTYENGNQSVEIKAKYPWGVQLNESIFLSNLNDSLLSPKQLEVLDGRKKVHAHSVSSTISLASMFLNAICDSYDESNFNGNTRPLLRLHRKLAPYKISFSTSSSDDSTEELGELALYLCRKLRTNHVSSLLLPSSLQSSLDEQFLQYDQLGVPYTVVLNQSTLKDGIASLRNRDTTLKEQVHISNLPEYVQMLFKNY